MTKYTCNVCNVFEYNDEEGNSDMGIAAGTKPEDFPEGWKCPICGANKSHMIAD
jgi:rubredoxin